MEEARQAVRTMEVTRAVRSTTLRGVKVTEGDMIAIVDDELKLTAPSANVAVSEALASIVGEGTSLITLYYRCGYGRG